MTELLVVATFYYLILTTVWGYIQNWIEKRMDPDRLTATELKAQKSWTMRMMGFGARGDRLVGTRR
jgi:polar amino acid transport system permease protein